MCLFKREAGDLHQQLKNRQLTDREKSDIDMIGCQARQRSGICLFRSYFQLSLPIPGLLEFQNTPSEYISQTIQALVPALLSTSLVCSSFVSSLWESAWQKTEERRVSLDLQFQGKQPIMTWKSRCTESGSREKWNASAQSISCFLCTSAHEMVPPTRLWVFHLS